MKTYACGFELQPNENNNISFHNSSIRDILDMPDEMLVEIILYLNARERLALSNSCQRFNRLVFEEKLPLRCLDFSSEGYLTLISDVQEYFNDRSKYDHIRKINISNIYCTRPRQMLQSIGKAKNLIDVNITGFEFKDVKQLASFLKPLEQLKKLSIDWPSAPVNNTFCCRILQGPFKALTHLRMTLSDVKYKKTLVHVLELCQQLEKLYLVQIIEHSTPRGAESWLQPPKKLKKLKIAAYYGSDAECFRKIIVDMLPDPEQWAQFQPCEAGNMVYSYFEKNPEVSPELRAHVLMDATPFAQSFQKVGWFLRFESLLKEVMRIIHQTVWMNFCCLSHCSDQYSCLLRIKDTKLLLKNPRHQISYLYLNHNIEPECDVHLVAMAFPGLTKLGLSNIIKSKASIAKKNHLETGFKRKRLALEESNEAPEPNSSFTKLIESTPHLKDLSLRASALREGETWDLNALCLIASWENLTTLYLAYLPIRSGQFLVEIGKRCTNLQKLRLESLGPRGACCYRNELLQMFAHSRNLKDFSLQQDNFGQVSRIFTTLADNIKLRRVHVKSLGKGNTVHNLVLSIQRLARSCTLILLICEIEGMTQIACDKLKSSLQRLKDELDRQSFQFEIIRWNGIDRPPHNSSLHSIHKDLLSSHQVTDTLCLDCL